MKVFTNGCFDVLHIGHLRYLEASKKLGDLLVVGLNSDSSVRALKGNSRPINSELDRAELLCGLRAVDYVVIFDETDAKNFLQKLQPQIYTKGKDYQAGKLLPEAELASEIGMEIAFIDLVEGKSTTNILKCLSQD